MNNVNPNSRMPGAMLFDFDGTIVDSEPVALACLEEYASSLRFVVTDELRSLITGSSYIDLFKHISSLYPALGDHRTVLGGYLRMLNRALETDVDLLPGVAEWLQRSSSYCPLGVVSGSLRDQILPTLSRFRLSDYFAMVISAEDVTIGKPSPECYRCASNRLHLRPSDIIVFEDSALGVAAARDAEMFTVGVMAGNRGTQNLGAANCLIPSFAESRIEDILQIYRNGDRRLGGC